MTPSLSLSIVSHGQGQLIRPLLEDLRSRAIPCHEIVLTLNLPEDESFFEGFGTLPLVVVRNANAKGFGSNHNAAFRASSGTYFVVVNPDIRLDGLRLEPLMAALEDPDVGIAAPAVYSSRGELQDSARRFPTFTRLLSRKLRGKKGPDYTFAKQPIEVDWVAGMFMVFRRVTYANAQGFDERFFMYFEDVDLCRRLHAQGKKILLVPEVSVVHDAQRASRRKLKHFFWHLTSATKFLLGS